MQDQPLRRVEHAGGPIPAGRWPALDGLRAVAIGLVVAGHAAREPSLAAVGVELFFGLSGFLITGLLLDEYARTGQIRVGAFWARRALRIFPAFYVSLLVALILLWQLPDLPSRGLWVASATYSSNYHLAVHPAQTPLTHTWSLAVEEQFYLIWPLLLAALLAGGRTRCRFAVGALILGIGLWRVFLQEVAGASQTYLYFAFDTRADFLAMGAFLATTWRAPSSARPLSSERLRFWLPLLTAAAIVTVSMVIEPRLGYAASYPMRAVLIAILLAQLLQLGGRGVWGLLDHPVVRWVGALSYSLYLYHLLVWPLVASTFDDGFGRLMVWGAAASVLASLSYYLVERPVLAWRDRRYPRTPRVEASMVVGAEGISSSVRHLPA